MNNIKKLLLTITILLFISHTNAQVFNAELGKVERYVLDDMFNEGLISQQQYDEKKQIAEMNLLDTVPKTASQTKSTGNGSISGQLSDENGSPIEFQFIRLVEALSLTAVANVVTDASGNYTIPDLIAGDYVLYSRGGGYLSYVWQSAPSGGPQLYAGCTSTIAADNYITVAVDQAVTGIDISTQLGGVVSGYIKDIDSGDAVTTLAATLYNVAGCDTTLTGNIDAVTGSYTIDSVPNGTYKLYLSDRQVSTVNVHIPQLYPNIECNACRKLAIQGTGDDLVIDNYNAINNINFDMSLGASISGKIVDAITGDALPDFALFLVFDELNNYLFPQLVFGTNNIPSATGDYVVGGLLPGSYYLQGGDFGLDFYQREVYNNTPCYWSGCDRSAGDPIVLGARQAATNIDFLLERGGKISGTITSALTGLPITDANVQVQFLDSNEVVVGGARIKSDGTYVSARALPPGDYAVRTGSLFAGLLTQPYVNEKYDNIVCSGLACDLTTADVNVTVDNTTANIDFALDVGLSFSGTITEAVLGNPIPDVHVLVYKDMEDGTVKFANWATTSNGSDAAIGEFEVSGLPPGTYYAVTNNGSNLPFLGYRPAQGLGWLDILYDGMICPATGCDILQGTPIVMTNTKSANESDNKSANKSTNTTINLTLQQGASISGQVTDDVQNSPIADIQINVYNQSGVYYGSYTTDELGNYRTAGLPADTYYLTTSSFEVLIDTVYGNRPCFSGVCDYQDANPVTLSNQQSLGNINFVLIPQSDFVFSSSME